MFQWLVIVMQVVLDPWFKHEKTSIDPVLMLLRLLSKFCHYVTVEFQISKSSGRLHRGYGCEFSV